MRRDRPLRLADLLLPPRCGGCGSALHGIRAGTSVRAAGTRWWCERCRDRWGPPVGWWDHEPGTCAGWAAAAYAGPVRSAVRAAKRGASEPLAELLGQRVVPGMVPRGAVVTWVPAHPRRELRRPGVSQSLAAAVAAATGAPCRGLLVRRITGRRQAGLEAGARRASPERLGLRALPGPPQLVVVVDDVRTTGTTLDASAAALRAAGSSYVIAVTATAVLGGAI